MSGYKTHFLVGLIITVLLSFFLFYQNYLVFSLQNCLWLLVISFVFSLLPDIDIGTSIIRKVAIVAFVIFLFINGISPIGYVLGAIVIIIQFLPHRGITHTFICGAVLSGLLYFFFNNWMFSIVAAFNFVSHLIMDEI